MLATGWGGCGVSEGGWCEGMLQATLGTCCPDIAVVVALADAAVVSVAIAAIAIVAIAIAIAAIAAVQHRQKFYNMLHL